MLGKTFLSLFIIRKFKTYLASCFADRHKTNAIQFYRNSNQLHLREPLKNQFHRASLSIVLNLAEGSAKATPRDRRKFYRISLGSLREVQAILDIAGHVRLIKEADKLGAYLYKLCQNT